MGGSLNETEEGELWMLRQPVFWIGGSACAGKSTLAEMYAEKYGLALYACDGHFNDHLKRITVEQQPAMSRISRLTANEVFLTRVSQLDEAGCFIRRKS